MRDVAIVATARQPLREHTTLTSVELIAPVIADAVAAAGLQRSEVGFWCHGSCDYMSGQPFSFVAAVDAIGAWPPIVESHVEGDGAMALYEAWIKLQTGEADTAVVFANGKTTAGPIDQILVTQMDPYVVAPLWPGANAVAALQARACLEAGVLTRGAMDEVAAAAAGVDAGTVSAATLVSDPLTAYDIGPPRDSAAAVVLAADDAARSLAAAAGRRPAWICGIDHRIANQRLDSRSMLGCPSATVAAQRAGAHDDRLDVAELYDPYSHQHLLLRQALGIDVERTSVNPSGGALAGNPQMAAGLLRFVEVAERLMSGAAERGLAHSASGPLLQQNLVAVLEGR